MLRCRAGQWQSWENNPGVLTHGVLPGSLSLVYSDVSVAECSAFDQAYLLARPPSIHKVITLISTISAATAPGCEGLTQQGPSSDGGCHCVIQTTALMERSAACTKLQPQDSPSAVSAHACAPSPSSPLQNQSPAGPAKGREENTSYKSQEGGLSATVHLCFPALGLHQP